MRIEQIIATVARTLVIANVREICRVVSFAAASCLHLWLMRMSVGTPCYLGAHLSGDALPSIRLDDCRLRTCLFSQGSKRGKTPGQSSLVTRPNLATANSRWITAKG